MDFHLRPRRQEIRWTIAACIFLVLCNSTLAQIAGNNVNMVSGTQWPGGDPFLQRQNEPSIAVSSRNPFHLLAGANDYRSVDLALTTNGETGDAWLGLFKSLDGGATWRSILLPGCPYNTPICAGAPAVQSGGYAAAADPTVRAGSNGMFYYSGLVFNRGLNPSSAIIVSRLIDLNNKENADPKDILNGDSIQYVSTSVVATGTPSSFLDKPTMAVDIPRWGAPTCNLSVNQPGNGVLNQSFAAGNVYVTYTAFQEAPNTDPENVTGPQPSKLYFVRSTNCGATWSKPLAISGNIAINQGTSIAIDPTLGTIYVAWREFQYQSGNISQPNAIVMTASFDGGRNFTPPLRISTFTPFDEGTTNTSFRTNAYPTITVDNSSRVYVAYAARNTVPSGDARIVLTDSFLGLIWSKPVPIDNPPIDPILNPSGRGHQIMPALTFAGGKLSLLYYDLRLDHTYGLYTPLLNLSQPTGLYSETPELAGELALNPPDINAVFNLFIDDSMTTIRRHTFDLRMTQALPGKEPVFAPSIPISQYSYGCCAANQTDIEQMEFNAPNLPLFKSGTAPFMGDYVDLAAGPTVLPSTSKPGLGDPDGDADDWHFNTSANTPTTFHAAWTDNRDVQPPADGDWTHYTPPISPSLGTTSIFEPGTAVPACQPGFTGSRNQNIYTAPISGGLIFGAPSNAKTLGTTVFNGNTVPFQRAFVVVAQNTTEVVKSFRLTVTNQPPGGSASFLQFSLLTTLDLSIPPMSSASRPVFVVSLDPTASVTINIAEIAAPQGTLVPNGLTGSTTLNPDATNPGITNPTETNPGITNPGITNFEVTNPGITNPGITNPTVTNPGITNPGITNPGITNSTFQNETVVNPGITNPGITNPGITNASIANPGITNPGITNVNPANVSISDTQWTVVNNGNTTGAYTVNLASSSTVPQGNVLQLIISKLYQTPAAPTGQSCNLAVETHNVIVTNIVNPVLLSPTNPGITNPGITNPGITNATVSLAPGETADIDIRVVNTDIHAFPTFNAASSILPVVVSQSVNTQQALASGGSGTTPTPPISVPPLIITTTTLPDGVSGSVYTASIITQGGNPTAHTFSVNGTLPPGLTLNAGAGAIAGIPTTLGSFTFTIQVQDVGSTLFTQHTATQTLTIRIAAPLVVVPPIAPPSGGQGAPYSQTITITGGTPPITFTLFSGALPAGLTLQSNGTITGVPTGTGTFNFIIQATDSSSPPQVTLQSFTITIVAGTGTPQTLTFVAQPQNSIEGQPLANSPIQVQAVDVTGAPVANANVGMTLAGTPPCSTATLAGTVPQATNGSGIASFPDLNINRGQAGFSLLATAGNATTTSNLFNVEGYCDTGSMNAARHNHQVITLLNGKVLVAGGAVNPNSSGALASAELYDPATHSFTTVGSMNAARVDFTTTLLPNGQVLVTGGFNDTTINSSAELFDPSTNTFTLLTGTMSDARSEHVATLLANGKVLITGGNDLTGNSLATAEIFDPATNTFTPTTHSMSTVRQIHHADLLPNGQVLVEGGFDTNGNPLASAELYNPIIDTFTLTGSMNTARGNHGTALLYSGQMLVAGGLVPSGTSLALTATAELYDPATGKFTPTGNMSIPRGHYTMPVLADGTVFNQGGATLPAGTNADIYNPATGTFRATGNFTTEQTGLREGELLDGTVLLASGVNSSTVVVPNSEIFYPIAPPTSITFTTTVLGNAIQDQPYTQLLLEKGGIGNLTWSETGALPTGITLSPQGILSGTPSVTGSFPITVTVTDSSSPAKIGSANFTFVVASALQFTATQMPSALSGAAYSQLLPVSGGVPPYTSSAGTGLPAGLSLNSTTGIISGTTTALGTFTFTATVTDSFAPPQKVTQTLTLVVVAPLAITTTTLPNGTVGSPYSATITTTGGSGTVSFAISAGALPLGLSLSASGVLSGTSSGAGTFSFSATATDQSFPPQVASESYTVLVAAMPTGVPAQLTFVSQPTATIAGQPISPAVTLQVLDTTGAPVPGLIVTLGTAPSANSPILSGTLSVATDASGIATFSNVVLDRAGTGFTLVASISAANSSGMIQSIAAPPSVQPGALESDTQIELFSERRATSLPSALAVDVTAPGVYSSTAALTPGTVPSGTAVDTYYLHSDPVGVSRIVSQLMSGEVTFPTNVLGLAVADPNLSASDAVVGLPGTAYPATGRGLKLGSPTDTIILSADRRTVTFHLSVSSSTDDVRVVTAANSAAGLSPVTSAAFNSLAAPGSISTVAGSTWVFPGAGLATAAPLGLGADFNGATVGLVADPSGSVYIADLNNQMVFKVSGGALSFAAGTGVEGYFGDGGPATTARLDSPMDVAFSPAGQLYVLDSNNSVVRRIDASGNITTVVGNGIPGYSGDGGQAVNASLNFPEGIAFDTAGNLFIADYNNLVIRKVDTSGIITTVTPSSVPAGFNGFCGPQAVRAGPSNAIFISDFCLNEILRLDSAGNLAVVVGNGTFGYSGDGGPAINASLNDPSAVAFDAAGNLFIADELNNVIRKVDNSGIITTVIGSGGFGFSGDGGPGALALLAQPGGLAFDSTGNLYIADTNNERIRKVDTTGTITTVAGNGRFKYAGDGGPATGASLDSPTAVAVDPGGNIFAADIANLVVRRINPAGAISTYVGTGVAAPTYTGDGGPATAATIFYPTDLQADGASNLFLSEGDRLHKINSDGTITTLLNGGVRGVAGQHLAIDNQGDFYFVSPSLTQVQKLDTTGAVTVVAGTGATGFSGDNGPATAATFRLIRGLTVDSVGNLYIADAPNNRVRRVDTSGIITTVAGNGTTTSSGDGGSATSAGVPNPFSLVVDGSGNLFIGSADRVRKVDGSGTISTIAGGGFISAIVDGIAALNATFNIVQGLAFDSAGNLYVSDRFNDRIRKITGVTTTPPFIFNAPSGLSVTTKGLPRGLVGTPYFQTLSAVGGAGQYTWSISSGSVPAGLSLSSAGAINGTPTSVGASSFVVKVTDAVGSTATQPITITIVGTLAFTPQTLSAGLVGISFSFPLIASSGTTPYTFLLMSGTLPAGITLAPNGQVSGTPSVVGASSFQVRVTDSSVPPQTATQAFTLVVVPVLAITTATLPNGTVAAPYSATISTTGGSGTVSFAVSAGALPAGLTLSTSGVLSGTPTAGGTFSFTVVATDQTFPPQLASQAYTVTMAGNTSAPANVSFLVQPQNAIASQPMENPIQVQVLDASFAAVPGALVTLGFNGSPACSNATINGVSSQTAITDSSGVATFSGPTNITIDRGHTNYTLAATAGTVNAVSTPFNVEGFCSTATPSSTRYGATATLLQSGKVLLAGGQDATAGVVATAEIYDPVAGTLTATGSMGSARLYATATLLNDGTVLMTGGTSSALATPFSQPSSALSSAEIYNPATGQFTLLTSSMSSVRVGHTAALLLDGTVLIAGGFTGGSAGVKLNTAELYNPTSQTFTPLVATMTDNREAFTATLLTNGRVLLAGGLGSSGQSRSTAELYDPFAKMFTATLPMVFPHAQHAAALLLGGQVAILGGVGSGATAFPENAIELFDPSSSSFSLANAALSPTARVFHSATALADGRVLVDGGFDFNRNAQPSAEILESSLLVSIPESDMQFARAGATATLLQNETVLFAGGTYSGPQGSQTLSTLPAEIFYPADVLPFSITTTSDIVTLNSPFSFQLRAIDGTGTLTWQVTSGSLPAGVTLSQTGLLSGTPTASGSFSFSVQVTDSATPSNSTTGTFFLFVSAPQLSIPSILPDANPGVAYNQPIFVSGGTAPYTFTQISGALPPGLTLTGAGVVSGTTTPTGTFTFTVQVTDSSALAVSAVQTIKMSVAPPLAITTTTLPNGIVGTAYSASITTTGGLAPLSFFGGNLPPGLTLSATGVLSGTPTTSGTFAIEVQVSDFSASPQTAFQFYTIIVSGTPVASMRFVNLGSQFVSSNIVTASVLALDASNNPIPNTQITVAVGTNACPAEGSSPNSAVTDVTGTAAFSIDILGGGFGYTLTATSFNNITVTSGTFNVGGSCDGSTPKATHYGATTTVLNNGQVLVAGGQDSPLGNPAVATAELYDPVAAKFTLTGSMTVARAFHTATLLPNGTVLVVGGLSQVEPANVPLASVEVYNPTSGTFASLGSMSVARFNHTATLLADGTVLVSGGNNGSGAVTSAEIINPTLGTFTLLANSMNAAREMATATRLPNGNVLIAGGLDMPRTVPPGLLSAEIYNPTNQSFTLTAPMNNGHAGHTATLLTTGKVLVAGGENVSVVGEASNLTITELYDPSTGTFSLTGPMSAGRAFHTATLLQDNKVLVAGGDFSFGLIGGSNFEVFDPSTGNFTAAGAQLFSRASHGAALLNNGTILLVGGSLFTEPSEIYFPPVYPLIFLTTALPGGVSGTAYNASILTTGGFAPVTFQVTSGSVPPGFTLNTQGVLSGVPSSSGTFTFSVTATDSSTPAKDSFSPQSATQVFTVTVN